MIYRIHEVSRRNKTSLLTRIYVLFGLTCFLVCHQQNTKSKAGSPYSPAITRIPPSGRDAGAKRVKPINPANAIIPPSPSRFHAMMRPMNAKSMNAVISMRSLSIAILPFFTQSATKNSRNTTIASVPIILATQRKVVIDRVDTEPTSFIFVSNLLVDSHIATKLVPSLLQMAANVSPPLRILHHYRFLPRRCGMSEHFVIADRPVAGLSRCASVVVAAVMRPCRARHTGSLRTRLSYSIFQRARHGA